MSHVTSRRRVCRVFARVFDHPPVGRLRCTNRDGGVMPQRRKTTTSNFGVSTREGHDSTPFYERFRPPEVSSDDEVPAPLAVVQPFLHGDARHMDGVADGSVALVVTSPPYFAGKQYEEELEREGVPSS